MTTPGGTATSSSSFTVVCQLRTITSFSPTSGRWEPLGDTDRHQLHRRDGCHFNGTAASTFTVVSATQITATVPASATTGTLSVTTPGGTATSTSSFTVTAWLGTLYTLMVQNIQNGASKDRWVWVQDASGIYYGQSGARYVSSAAPAGVDVPSKNGTQQFTLPNGTYTVLVSTSNSPTAAVAESPPDPVTISSAATTVQIS